MKGTNSYINLVLIILAIMAHCSFSVGQSSINGAEEKKARISLDYININNTGPRLLTVVKAREKKQYQVVNDIKVNFFFRELDEDRLLGSVVTNSKGEALFPLPETMRKIIDTTSIYTFIASIEDQEGLKDTEKEIEIKRAKMNLSLYEEDTIRKVKLVVFGIDESDNFSPREDLEPIIYVERMFGLLRVSEEYETTDEDGQFEIEFPNGIPGDAEGSIKIVAKLEESDDYGTLIASDRIQWGEKLIENSEIEKRELWSSRANAPLYLIIIVNGLILLIWGTIAYLIYYLIKIKNLGKLDLDKN